MNYLLPFSWESGVLIVYFGVLLVLSVFGLHRFWIIARYLLHRHERLAPPPPQPDAAAPRVLIQLPIYNEGAVATRLIRAIAQLDYPLGKLEVQVLDDSTDDTPGIVAPVVRAAAAAGLAIKHLRRGTREGYKAGALAWGLRRSRAELVAIFDADFVPAPDFLRHTVPFFADAGVGLVQTRWEHMNRDQALLTRAQAVLIDGHFVIEQTARNRTGCFFSFNGTAGVWRRAAIDAAGGWRADTLTEDLDLSYRAQLLGWRFVYLPDYTTPAELPEDIQDFKTQQHRWTKGGVQTARKMLPSVIRARIPLHTKVEGVFHLLSNFCYIGMVLVALLLWPSTIARTDLHWTALSWLDMPIMMATSLSFAIFYAGGQIELRRGVWRSIAMLPAVMCLGVVASVSNAFAVIEGCVSRGGEFVRTPKMREAAAGRTASPAPLRPNMSRVSRRILVGVAEWMLCLESVGMLAYCIVHAQWITIPFVLTFVVGYGTVSFGFGWGLGRRAALPGSAGMLALATGEGNDSARTSLVSARASQAELDPDPVQAEAE